MQEPMSPRTLTISEPVLYTNPSPLLTKMKVGQVSGLKLELPCANHGSESSDAQEPTLLTPVNLSLCLLFFFLSATTESADGPGLDTPMKSIFWIRKCTSKTTLVLQSQKFRDQTVARHGTSEGGQTVSQLLYRSSQV